MTDEDLRKAEALALKIFPVNMRDDAQICYDRNENQRKAFTDMMTKASKMEKPALYLSEYQRQMFKNYLSDKAKVIIVNSHND